MVRGKVEMKKIENATSRQVTFSKRRNGLMKKAFELSVLCDAEIALIIFSQNGKLHEFASSDMQKTMKRYHGYVKDTRPNNGLIRTEQQTEQLKHEVAVLENEIRVLETSRRKFLGQDLDKSSLEELQHIDRQLDQSLRRIRTRKDIVFKKHIEDLKTKESLLLQENQSLSQRETMLLQENQRLSQRGGLSVRLVQWTAQQRDGQFGAYPCDQRHRQTVTMATQPSEATTSSYGSQVETGLFIGLPDTGRIGG